MKNAEEAMESDIGSPDLSGLAEASLFADSGFGDTIVGSTFGGAHRDSVDFQTFVALKIFAGLFVLFLVYQFGDD